MARARDKEKDSIHNYFKNFKSKTINMTKDDNRPRPKANL